MNAAGMVGVLSIVILFSVIGIVCCSLAIVHHGKRLQLGLQLRPMLNDAGKNPIAEVTQTNNEPLSLLLPLLYALYSSLFHLCSISVHLIESRLSIDVSTHRRSRLLHTPPTLVSASKDLKFSSIRCQDCLPLSILHDPPLNCG